MLDSAVLRLVPENWSEKSMYHSASCFPENGAVGISTTTCLVALMLVEPGNADNSYLIHKLENAPTIDFNPMPPGRGLDPAVIQEIRTWINNGADRNN